MGFKIDESFFVAPVQKFSTRSLTRYLLIIDKGVCNFFNASLAVVQMKFPGHTFTFNVTSPPCTIDEQSNSYSPLA